jgi:hypothetical protein
MKWKKQRLWITENWHRKIRAFYPKHFTLCFKNVLAYCLHLFSEPCCALKYYPEIEICVKEQKGEQVLPYSKHSIFFLTHEWVQ